jgi:hypothetical protein
MRAVVCLFLTVGLLTVLVLLASQVASALRAGPIVHVHAVLRAEPALAGPHSHYYAITQTGFFTSQPVIEDALGQPEVGVLPMIREITHPEQWLREHLQLSLSGSGELRVSLHGEKPEELAVVLTAVVRAYLRLHPGNETRRLTWPGEEVTVDGPDAFR